MAVSSGLAPAMSAAASRAPARAMPALHESLAFGAAVLAVLFSALDGMRVGASVGFGDVFLVLTALALACGLATRGTGLFALPPWLVGAGALLLGAALLVELFPPRAISSTSLLYSQASVYVTARAAPVASAFGVSSGSGSSNLTSALRLAGTLVFVPMLLASVATSAKRLRRVTDAWIFGVAVSGLVALAAATGLANLGPTLTGADYSLTVGSSVRQAGLTAQPVLLALSCSTAFPVVLARATQGPPGARMRAGLVAAILVLAALVSGSRAALLGIGASVVLLPFIQPGLRRKALGIAAVSAVLLLVAVALGSRYLPIVGRLTGGVSSTSVGDTARLAAVRDGLSAFGQSPIFGNGFQFVRGAHDLYVQFLQSGGFIALAGFLLFAGSLVRIGLSIGRSRGVAPEQRVLARALIVATGVWLGEGIFENPIQDRFLYVPAGLLLALFMITLRDRQPAGGRPGGA